MGIYIYSMRAKVVPLYVFPDGEVGANLYSYAYKHTSYWKGDPGERSYTFMTQNVERNAEKVFENRERSGYVIVGDMEKKGRETLDGCSVYKDVTSALWWDTDKFPGTIVGWVEATGKSLRVTDRTKWSDGKVYIDEEKVWKPYRSRSVLEYPGKVRREQIVGDVHTSHPYNS